MGAPVPHPEFLRAAGVGEDPYWAAILDGLARGVCPPGCFIYKSAYLGVRSKGVLHSILFRDVHDAERLRADVTALLGRWLKLRSPAQEGDLAPGPLMDIKKKATRRQLFEVFVARHAERQGLGTAEARELLDALLLRSAYRIIRAPDVAYEDGWISDVEGLRVSARGAAFEATLPEALASTDTRRKSLTGDRRPFGLRDVWKRQRK